MTDSSLSTFDYSILAMDVYNTSPGLMLPAGATLITTSAELNIGGADGFAANVYLVGDQVVISFLGTNSSAIAADALNGWPIADGDVGAQAIDAANLYFDVLTNLASYGGTSISATGHSLGGALAGLLNALYGVPAAVFDNEPYQGAAEGILVAAQNPSLFDNGPQTLATFFPTILSNGAPAFPNGPPTSLNGAPVGSQGNTIGITGAEVQGEMLESIRSASIQSWTPTKLLTGSSSLDGYGLHQPQLVPIYEYGNTVYSGGSWLQDGNALLASFLSDTLGNNFGVTPPGMREALADSGIAPDDALAGGVADVNGDVGLMAVFSAANVIGEALQSGSPNEQFSQDVQTLTDIAVSYGLDLAENGSTDQAKANGLITATSDDAILGVDLDGLDWELGGVSPLTIPGEAAFVEQPLDGLASSVGNFVVASQWLYGDSTPDVDEVDIAVNDSSFTDALPGPPAGSDAATALFESGSGNETIDTASLNTIVQLGSGTDEVVGGSGNDLLIGGSGSDTFFGGGGNNVIIGGSGGSTVDYRYATSGLTFDPSASNSAFDGVGGFYLANNGSGGADELIGIKNVTGSNFDDTFVLSNDQFGQPSASLNVLDGAGGFNVVDLTGFNNDVGVTLSWNSLGETKTTINVNLVGQAFGEHYPTLTNMEEYDLPDFANNITINADDHGVANAEPLIFESGSTGSIYNISVAEEGAPIAIVGGGEKDTININTMQYDGSEGSSGAIVIDGEAGGAAINVTGSANVVFVEMPDAANLSQTNIIDLANAVESKSGADPATGPLLIIVNPSQQETLSLDGTALKGAQTKISEQDFSWDTDEFGSPLFGIPVYDEVGGQMIQVGEQMESGQKYTATIQSLDGLEYHVSSSGTVGASNLSATLNLYGLLQGDDGISINGGTPPISRTENVFYDLGSTFDSNEYDYQEAGVPNLSTTAITVSSADFMGDDNYGPNSGVATPPPAGSTSSPQTNPSTPTPPVPSGPVTLSDGQKIVYGTPTPTVFNQAGDVNIEQGQTGADTFLYNGGDGSLTVADGPDATGQADSVLNLGTGIDASNLSVSGDAAGNLVLTDGVLGDSVDLQGMLAGQEDGQPSGVGQINFSDGTVISASELVSLSEIGNSANTALYGNSGANLFESAGFAHSEKGGGGADTFIYNSGYGQLDIDEDAGAGSSSTAVLQLGAGITQADLSVSPDNSGDILLSDSAVGDQINLQYMLNAAEFGVGSVSFSDGTSLTRNQLLQLALTGSPNNTSLYGTSGADTFNGAGYANYEQGNGGADTFNYNLGEGNLNILEDAGSGVASTATLALGPGIEAGDLTVSEDSSGNIILSVIGSGATVTLDKMALIEGGVAEFGVSSIEFADGTSLTLNQLLSQGETPQIGQTAVFGSSGAEVLSSGGSVSYLQGNGGADTFTYAPGDGSVEINEDAGTGLISNAVIQLGAGISVSDISATASAGGNLVINDGHTGDIIRIDLMANSAEYGVQTIEFADGTTLTRAQVLAMDPEIYGTPTSTSLIGTPNAERFDGLGYATLEQGNGGADTFVYDVGYGQLEINEDAGSENTSTAVLQLGAGFPESNLGVSSDGSGNLLLTDGTAGDKIKLDGQLSSPGGNGARYGVQAVQFSDGAILSRNELAAFESELLGTPTAKSLDGTSGADLFDSRGDANYEQGNGGADTFIYDGGYGQLEINEDASSGVMSDAVLQFGAGLNSASLTVAEDNSGDLIISDGIVGDQIKLDGMARSSEYGVESVAFVDGSTLTAQQLIALVPPTVPSEPSNEIDGSPTATSLVGTSGADLFDSKGYATYEQGGGGADTFVYNAGYGPLEINEDAGTGNVSTAVLQLGAEISRSALTVSEDGSGDVLLADGTAGDAIKLNGMASSSEYGVQSVNFGDGSTLTAKQLIALVPIAAPTEPSNEIDGSPTATSLVGTSGADLFDSKGYATYEQGDGGADTFIYNAGYGSLEINEDSGSTFSSSSAVLQLGPGINASDLTASFDSAGDEIITDGVAGDQIKIDDMANQSSGGQPEWGVGGATFTDGTTLTRQQLVNLPPTPILGSATDTSLVGDFRANIFDSKGFATYEQGDGGADTFVYNAGYGSLEINEDSGSTFSSSSAVLQFGPGINASDLTASFDSAGDEIITDGVAGDQIKIDDMANQSSGGQPEWGVGGATFTDGTTLTRQQLVNLPPTPILGSATDTSLVGDFRANIFDSKGFATYEQGDGGADTFVYNAGYGSLEINEDSGSTFSSSSAVLQFGPGISASDLTASFDSAGDEIITDGVAGDQIKLDDMANQSSGGQPEWGVGGATFADGTTLTRQQLVNLPSSPVITVGRYSSLIGSDIAQVFDGDGAATYEQGNGGADTFIYNAGYGTQEINEDAGQGVSSAAVLRVGGTLTASDFAVSSDSAGDVILTDGILGDQIKLDEETAYGAEIFGGNAGSSGGGGGNGASAGSSFNNNAPLEYGVSLIEFADGTSITKAQLQQDALIGSPTNTRLFGTNNADTFDSQGFATYAQGNGGADTFTYNTGYGQLEINEDAGWGTNSTAMLQFGPDITAADLIATNSLAGGIVLTDGVTGDQITLDGEYNTGAGGATEYGVAAVLFSDGSSLTRQQLINLAATGSLTNTRLYGSGGADTIDSRGFATYAQGYGGADTFIYNAGYGQLEVNEDAGWGTTSTAVLQVGGSLTASDFTASFDSSGDVMLTDGVSGDQIKLDAEVAFGAVGALEYGVSAIDFADGTSITKAQLQQDAVTGSPTNTRLYGSGNAETLDSRGYATYAQGNDGADTFIYNAGYGQLEINEDAGWGNTSNAVLVVGADLSASQLTVTSDSANDLILTDGITGDQVKLDSMVNGSGSENAEYGVSQVDFADGTVLTAQQLIAILPPLLDGSAGDQTLSGFGFRSNNVFLGGNGDTLNGVNGDTYELSSNAGTETINPAGGVGVDTIAFDASVDAADVTYQVYGDNLVLTDAKLGIAITVENEFWTDWQGGHDHVGSITFADGTVWTPGQGDLTYDGTAGGQTLTGSTWTPMNLFLGGNGDTLNGVNADTYQLSSTAGVETINPAGGVGVDTIAFDASVNAADVTYQVYGDNLVLTDATLGIAITVENEFWTDWQGGHDHVGSITFADGTVWTPGQGDLTYDGTAGGQTLTGSTWTPMNLFLGGNGDTLNGVNNDTYQFTSTAGVETINPAGGVGVDTIAFDSSVNAADVTYQVYGDNLVLTDAKLGMAITVENEFWTDWQGGYNHVGSVTFADGTVWTPGQGELTFDGTAGGQTLTGSTWTNTNLFLGGNGDALNGVNTDIYKIGANGGTEAVNLGSNDTIQFADNIVAQDLWFVSSGGNLQIDVLGTQEQITINNWTNNTGALAAIDSADGLQLDTQLNALINAMATFSADNPGFNPASATSMPTDSGLQSSLAAAWHPKAA